MTSSQACALFMKLVRMRFCLGRGIESLLAFEGKPFYTNSLEVAQQELSDHFVDVGKMIKPI
jgi:hypothetical protein